MRTGLLRYEAPRSFLGVPLLPEHSGHSVRVDGSIATSDRLWAEKSRACLRFPDGRRLPEERCDAARRRAQQELEISWNVTLNDLAGRIAKGRGSRIP